MADHATTPPRRRAQPTGTPRTTAPGTTTLRSGGPLVRDDLARDECGIGFVAHVDGRPRREIVEMAVDGLCGVKHRGAIAADAKSGDGAGVLAQIPRDLFAAEAIRMGARRTDPADLGVAFLFLAAGEDEEAAADRAAAREHVEEACRAEDIAVLGWRDVPVDLDAIGRIAGASMPAFEQAVLARPEGSDDQAAERAAYRARRRARKACDDDGVRFYAASWSFRTVTYKGMAAADQLGEFYLDLQDERFQSAFAVFHSRFSTNTAPTWERAQPFRMICHNGEINTIQGNVNLMRAREHDLGADWVDGELITPVIDADQSDSAKLDAALELIVRGGRDVRHSQAMLIPQVWEGIRDVDPEIRDFYRYHACLVEPWDGPAGVIFTDGTRVGAALDRNGLRPLRYHVCEDGYVVASSEVGAIRTVDHGPVRRERLGPGQMICVDPDEGGLQEDAEIKLRLGRQQPYGAWVSDNLHRARAGRPVGEVPEDVTARQYAYGFTKEEIISILRPMATQGKETTSSMGDDTPVEALSEVIRPVSHYLKQRFAQVTNPPIDHYREHEVMSLRTLLGPRRPILTERPEAAELLELDTFFLYPSGLQQIVLDSDIPFEVQAVDATFPVDDGPDGLAAALERLGDEAVAHVRGPDGDGTSAGGAGILVVSDVGADVHRCRVPIVLAVGAVHQRLLDAGLRTRTSIVAETDEAREPHDMACLLGYGADAIVPRLVLQTLADLADRGRIGGDSPSASEAQERYKNAVEDGVLKIMSKMGISVLDSYRSAQIFEALGLGEEVVETCLTGTTSTLGGVGLAELGEDVLAQHAVAYPGGGAASGTGEGADEAPSDDGDDDGDEDEEELELPSPGIIKWKHGGEFHDMNKPVVEALHRTLGLGLRPETEPLAVEDLEVSMLTEDGELLPVSERAAHVLRQATDEDRYDLYEEFAEAVTSRPVVYPRDYVEAVDADEAVPLEEVEPAQSIVTRFSTGAMSHGALSREAHENLAIALNMIGGKSNSGEGGEDPVRFRTRGTARDKDSRIKQVASGRFGVTPEYLAFAEELQIKMAQGSKPGEGGQLPGHKVSEEIARLRHTTPGATLISPPPHHDIYSIEDLAQLIFDLKQVNADPDSDVSVKLVSEAGIGQVAAGVVKALADAIHISGNDGGTGASPLSSIQHAGLPWELGLAEVQQTLRANGLRGRVRLRVDGGFKTGRDVMIAALLGADEYSFGTAALMAEGCILARACHRDTCPVGIATQREQLRERFVGRPEQVAAYLLFIAEDVRRRLAAAGLRSVEEAVGRVDLLRRRSPEYLEEHSHRGRGRMLDVSPLLADPDRGGERRHTGGVDIQQPRSELGDRVWEDALETVFLGGIVEYTYDIGNAQRTVGARLGGSVGLEFAEEPPNGVARLRFTGEAGQSFGAFATQGVELVLTGEANDYVGKGLGGGTIVIRPPEDDPGDPVLLGNTVLYGATSGELFVAGRAGERFAVRNSGATAVVEGTGDHACEYMTGGTVVILGRSGSNIGAGMSGGECYVHDPSSEVLARVNRQLVEAHRPGGYQLELLRGLVERHATLTGSRRATRLLERWGEAATGFWRIAPKTEVEKVASTSGVGAQAD